MVIFLSFSPIPQVFTALLGIAHFNRSVLWGQCGHVCKVKKIVDGFFKVVQYSFSRHSSPALFNRTSFGGHRNNTMELVRFGWSWDCSNRLLYIHETSAHVPGSTCLAGTWVLWCMDEMDVILYQHNKGFLLHEIAKNIM